MEGQPAQATTDTSGTKRKQPEQEWKSWSASQIKEYLHARGISTATCIEIGDLHEKMEEAMAKADSSPPPSTKKPKINKAEPKEYNFLGPLHQYGVQLLFTRSTGEWRRLVVSAGITLYNLHRAFQYALKPSQRDSTIEGMTFAFTAPDSQRPIAAKGTKLGDITLTLPAVSLHYTPKDNKLWTIKVEFIAPERADYMPRLCGSSEGNDDTALDPANKKLTTNRFAANTTTNKTKKRKGPAIRCFVGTDPTSTILGLLRKPLLSTSDSF